MSAAPTHYSVLGLAPSASAERIKRAYRDLAKKLHPDVSPAKDAEGQFAAIAAAYEVLSDPDKRRAYDDELARAELARRATDLRPHYSWRNVAGASDPQHDQPEATDLDELYDTFFGNRGKHGDHGKSGKAGGKHAHPPENGPA